MNLTAQPLTDIDKDDDGLIEISDLETLNAMRYRLDGSGLQRSSTTEVITTGCTVGGCKGYELTRDLDFNDAASYQDVANMRRWTTDAGWQPIGTAEKTLHRDLQNKQQPHTKYNIQPNNQQSRRKTMLVYLVTSEALQRSAGLDYWTQQ